jgi:hypothetical protein
LEKYFFCASTTGKINGCEPSRHKPNSFASTPLYEQAVLFPSGGFMPKNFSMGRVK